MKREVEIGRTNLKESCALSEIENKAVESARERSTALKYEHNEIEASIQNLKDLSLKEEMKFRALKSNVAEQVRLFHIDINKLHQEYKAKRQSLDDVEKRRQIMVRK